LRSGESSDLFPVNLLIVEGDLNPDPSIISSKINCVEVEGTNSSFAESSGAAGSLHRISIAILVNRCAHTNCFSGIFMTVSRVALPGGVSEVADGGVREALGSKALYISFLRGFPVPMRRAAVGAPEPSAEDGRDGGGMSVEGRILAEGGTLIEAWLSAGSIGFT
jgi:hypothetical protein